MSNPINLLSSWSPTCGESTVESLFPMGYGLVADQGILCAWTP